MILTNLLSGRVQASGGNVARYCPRRSDSNRTKWTSLSGASMVSTSSVLMRLFPLSALPERHNGPYIPDATASQHPTSCNDNEDRKWSLTKRRVLRLIDKATRPLPKWLISFVTGGTTGHKPRYSGEKSRLYPHRGGSVSPPGSPAQRITSSAWNRIVGGRVSPKAWAVLRLMMRSNFIGRSTGRSPGLAPLRSLST